MWYKYRHDACGGTSLWKENVEKSRDINALNYWYLPVVLTCGVCHESVTIQSHEDIQPVDDLSEAVYDVRYPDPPKRDDS